MRLSWSSLAVALFLGVVSAIGSGAIGRLVGGWSAAVQSWVWASAAVVAMLVVSIPVWLLQKKSARYSVVARGLVSFSLCGILLALGLPVFFITPIWTTAGAAIAMVALSALLWNGYLAHRHFQARWSAHGEAAITRSVARGTIDLKTFAKHLKLDPPSIFTFRPAAIGMVLGALLLVSMLIGLNLRNVYPIFAALAWGLPALIFASWVAQPVVMAFHEFMAILSIERRVGSSLLANEAD